MLPAPYTVLRHTAPAQTPQQDPQAVLDALSGAFEELSREGAAQTPQILAGVVAFLIFVALAVAIRLGLRAALGRVPMAPRIRILIARLAFFAVILAGGIAFLVVATDARLGQVLTGFGLFSVALGFALKSPLENMLSGILTILFSPFRIGDEIEVNEYAGRVETISIHDTIIRTFDGKRVAIPNVDVYLNTIVNQTAFLQRRYDVPVGIHYNDDLPRALRVARTALEETPGVRDTPEPLVLVGELGESSVNLILRFWSDPTMQNEFRIVSDVTTNAKLAFDREGITIPFPIRTLHIPDGGPKGAGELQVRMADEPDNGRETPKKGGTNFG